MEILILFILVFSILSTSLALYGWAIKRQENTVQSCASKISSSDNEINDHKLSCDVCSLYGEHPDCS